MLDTQQPHRRSTSRKKDRTMNMPRMYDEFAHLWTLISAPEDYAEEAACWLKALRDRLGPGRHRILELGVGGGNNLSHLTDYFQATAVDISEKMLAQAAKKIQKFGLSNVGIVAQDASAMSFPDDSFDCVSAAYVASVVPDPNQCVQEIKRVCRPGGRIVFLNHFKSQNPLLARLEELSNGLWNKMGWNSNLDLWTLMEENDLRIQSVERVNLFGYWKSVLCINEK